MITKRSIDDDHEKSLTGNESFFLYKTPSHAECQVVKMHETASQRKQEVTSLDLVKQTGERFWECDNTMELVTIWSWTISKFLGEKLPFAFRLITQHHSLRQTGYRVSRSCFEWWADYRYFARKNFVMKITFDGGDQVGWGFLVGN